MHLRQALGAAAAAALLFAMPVPAHADTYAPQPASQDFNGGTGGWDGTTRTSGLCVPALLCPAVSTDWSAGGADGNGYLRTRFGSVASTQTGTSTGIWTSPVFTYNGLGGKQPGSVTFDMFILKDVQALLDVTALNDTSYLVDLVDQTNGNAISVVPSTVASPNAGWTAIPSASVNPNQLKIGRPYRIRITTSYHAAVTVVASGEVGYDNVRLTTSADKGNGSGGGGGANGGSGITTTRQLRQLTKHYILPATGKVSGRQLKVKFRCPAIAAPKPCQIQFQGLRAGRFSPPATARKVLKIRAGHTRLARVRIKPQFVASYHHARKIWVKCTVRVGNVKVTVHRRMKLR
jgi:hypothetical protein